MSNDIKVQNLTKTLLLSRLKSDQDSKSSLEIVYGKAEMRIFRQCL